MTKLTIPAAGFALLASVLSSNSAIAATDTWSWRFDDTACGTSDDATCNGDTASNNGDTWTQNTSSGSGPDLTLQGWSDTADVSGPDTFETGQLRHYGDSGFGIVNRDTGSGNPEHAFGGDDSGASSDTFENMDAVLLSFDDVVTLDQVTMGWYSGDSDFSLLAWTGANTGPGSLTGDSYADLIAGGSGWSMLGHYYHSADSTVLPNGDLDFSVNAGGVSSSYYLLSVLNPELNTGCTGSNDGSRYCASNGHGGNDYFKMLALGGTTDDPGTNNEIPLPATAFLLLAALPLVRLGQRRRV